MEAKLQDGNENDILIRAAHSDGDGRYCPARELVNPRSGFHVKVPFDEIYFLIKGIVQYN